MLKAKSNVLVLTVALMMMTMMVMAPVAGAQPVDIVDEITPELISTIEADVPVSDDLEVLAGDAVVEEALLAQVGGFLFSWWGILIAVIVLAVVIYLVMKMKKKKGVDGVNSIDDINQMGGGTPTGGATPPTTPGTPEVGGGTPTGGATPPSVGGGVPPQQ